MNRPIRPVLAVLLLCSACSTNTNAQLTPEQFTREYADALRAASPGLKVEAVRNLELRVVSQDGKESTAFLDNAYDSYKQDPGKKAETIATFVAANIASIQVLQHEIDRTRIVPVIKDREWLREIQQAMLSRGAKEVPEHVFDDLCTDLVIVYAEDSPQNIRYLVPDDLKSAKLERKDLRALVTAGGDYEASLLLLDSFGCEKPVEVKGEVVVAIPSRDLLLVTGSLDQEGLAKVNELVQKTYHGGAYRLTPKLFVRRDGAFVEFTPKTQP
jgi:uncharacterized protein YtpQ (UPF0354 family)